jgi:prepilin-type N-terminal cleavage/methylation domain-containing protein
MKKMNHRSGFSLIELLIVMTIVGIVSTFVFASFSTVSDRIAFQNQVTSLQYLANDLRSRTFTSLNNSESQSDTYVYLVNLNNKRITTFKESDSNYFNDIPPANVLDDYYYSGTNIANLIDIKQIHYYDSSVTEPWMRVPERTGKLAIVYKAGDQNCKIVEETTVAISSDTVTMIKLPIFNLETSPTTPVKFAYIHKLSCNLEILNNEI